MPQVLNIIPSRTGSLIFAGDNDAPKVGFSLRAQLYQFVPVSIDKAASKGTIQAFKVEHMAPIHGDYVTWNDFVEDTITMTQYQPGQAPKPATGGTGGQ